MRELEKENRNREEIKGEAHDDEHDHQRNIAGYEHTRMRQEQESRCEGVRQKRRCKGPKRRNDQECKHMGRHLTKEACSSTMMLRQTIKGRAFRENKHVTVRTSLWMRSESEEENEDRP